MQNSGEPVSAVPPPRPVAPLSRWARALRLLTSPNTLLQATGLLTLIAVAAGAAWILPPSKATGDLPGDDELGTLAKHSFKANRDYDIPDPEATQARRDAAAAQVRPVYDFDASEAEDAEARLRNAFETARENLAEELKAPTSGRHSRARREAEAQASGDQLEAAAESLRSEFVRDLQAVVDPVEYRELARQSFSEKTEQAAIALTRGALSGEIIPSRELLVAEKGDGVTVRRLVGGAARGEIEIRDVDRIPDVAAVRYELTRIAQGLTVSPGAPAGLAHVTLPEDLEAASRRSAAMLAARLIGPTLSYNDRVTQERRRAAADVVKPVVLQYARGETIISDGERIEKRHLHVFHFIRDQARTLDSMQVRLGAALFTMLLVVSVFGLARRTVRRFRPGKRDLVFLAGALLGNLALLRATLAASDLIRDHYPQITFDVAVMALPLAAGTMLVRMLRSGESSVVFALVFAPLVALHLASHAPAAVGLVGAVVAADRMGRRSGRSSLPLAALHAGLAAALTVLALSLYSGRLMTDGAEQAAAAFLGTGILSPIAAIAVAPLFELLFGYVSESRLTRLANLNSPVLKELIIRAPGTYHHSLIVGALAEAGAKRVGAHPLLARVGGYYHDLGKADAPLMFAENQKSDNRLERLPPEQAAAVLQQHVVDGIRRAQDGRLPKAVQDFIVQHHGTAMCGMFLQRAQEQAAREGRPAPDLAAFHYPGPKPRSREIALVMLADAVESASRALDSATPERLQGMVPRVLNQIMLDGQLDDCDLTLADLHAASAAFADAIVDLHGLSKVEVLPGLRPPPGSPALPPAEPVADSLRVVK